MQQERVVLKLVILCMTLIAFIWLTRGSLCELRIRLETRGCGHFGLRTERQRQPNGGVRPARWPMVSGRIHEHPSFQPCWRIRANSASICAICGALTISVRSQSQHDAGSRGAYRRRRCCPDRRRAPEPMVRRISSVPQYPTASAQTCCKNCSA